MSTTFPQPFAASQAASQADVQLPSIVRVLCGMVGRSSRRLPLLTACLVIPVVAVLLLGCFVQDEFEHWVDDLDLRRLDRRLSSLGGLVLVAVAVLLVAQILEAALTGRFSF